ncbi:GNAT family N-acetyltransferase [Oceanospirillum sp.]|uniref:GNAT family N-acetyltransferase n=1 Tax=Oceanospirillum sp. TaxID=2021254 RepID=UPI003A9338D1
MVIKYLSGVMANLPRILRGQREPAEVTSGIKVRPVLRRDLRAIRRVCWRSFQHSVAKDLSAEGAKTFAGVITPKAFKERMRKGHLMFVALAGRCPVGFIELKEHRHIAVFFIAPEFQRQGVGRKLLEAVFVHLQGEIVTVNASLTSVAAYQRFGFELNGDVDESGGLVYQPMKLNLSQVSEVGSGGHH